MKDEGFEKMKDEGLIVRFPRSSGFVIPMPKNRDLQSHDKSVICLNSYTPKLPNSSKRIICLNSKIDEG